jgi:hypothetical protein
MYEDSTLGEIEDLNFINKATWLKDSEVRYRITKRQSRWYISLIFIHIHDPYRFLCRSLNNYETEYKAVTYAQIFQRCTQKDARGTLKTDENAFNICKN